MADILLSRHLPIFDPSKMENRVAIIGCGALGSRVFSALVELGITNISCYDFDVVEAHNLANQLFLQSHVGTHKVQACANWYELKTGYPPPKQMTFSAERITHESDIDFSGTVVFLMVDSMKARRDIFECHLHTAPALVIDGRMASTHGNVLLFDPANEAQTTAWENTLTDDETTELSPCGTTMTVGTTASVIANLAVWQLILWAKDPEIMEEKIDLFLRPGGVIYGGYQL